MKLELEIDEALANALKRLAEDGEVSVELLSRHLLWEGVRGMLLVKCAELEEPDDAALVPIRAQIPLSLFKDLKLIESKTKYPIHKIVWQGLRDVAERVKQNLRKERQ